MMEIELSFEIVEQLVRKQRQDLVHSTCLVLELRDEMCIILKEHLLSGHDVSLESAFRHAWQSLVVESPFDEF